MSRRRYPTDANMDAHASEAPGVACYAFSTKLF